MVQATSILLSIALLWFAAVVAPGPNFLVTTRTSLVNGRLSGVRVAFGIAVGEGIWGLAGFFSVHALFAAAPWLYLALKLCGAAYLIFLGAMLLFGSFGPETPSSERSHPISAASAFRIGLVTSIVNPRTALSTASLFAATLPEDPSIVLGLCAIAVMVGIAALWYCLVACVLTMRAVSAAFRRVRRWVDRVAGLAFMCFGTKLALER